MVSVDKYNQLLTTYSDLQAKHKVLLEEFDRIKAERDSISEEKQKLIDQHLMTIEDLKTRYRKLSSNRIYHKNTSEDRNAEIKVLKGKLKDEGVSENVKN